jgi:hypothetical protein
MTSEQRWVLARDEAGFSAHEAVWLEVPGKPESLGSATLAAAAPPGEPISQDVISLDEAGRACATEHQDKLRVVTYADVPEAASLGLMRWATEYQRLGVEQNAAMALIHVTTRAYHGRIVAGGPGAMTYQHAAPYERQSQAAAAALVTRVLGPQVGQLRSVFGPLFRPSSPQPDEVLGIRAVAFAAFHQNELARLATDESVDVDQFIADVDPEALRWRDQLLEDEEFAP